MRARSLKPGLFKNELLGGSDPLLTILFEGLWCMSDREGRLEDRPLRISAELFPYRRHATEKKVDGMLDWLHEHLFIIRYKVLGRSFIQVLAFSRHQRPHKNESPSIIQPHTCDEALPRSQALRPMVEVTRTKTASDFALTPDSGLLTPDSPFIDRSTSHQGAPSTADDSWLEADGCDQEAMQAWIEHRAVLKPPGLRPHERLAAAKILKGMGNAHVQRRAVQTAIANGWSNLRVSDGATGSVTRSNRPDPSKAERESADARRLEELKSSRAERGIPDFRDPWPVESADVYETALREAARRAPRARSAIGELGAAKRMAK